MVGAISEGEQEFYFSFIIVGGLALAGLLVVIGLSMVGLGLYRKMRKKDITNDFLKSNRTNGVHKTKGKF